VCLVCNLSQSVLNSLELNSKALSDRNFLGFPKYLSQEYHSALMIDAVDLSINGSTSIYRVR